MKSGLARVGDNVSRKVSREYCFGSDREVVNHSAIHSPRSQTLQLRMDQSISKTKGSIKALEARSEGDGYVERERRTLRLLFLPNTAILARCTKRA